jgi:ABC-type polysaccharide/polyol phosphate export permease
MPARIVGRRHTETLVEVVNNLIKAIAALSPRSRTIAEALVDYLAAMVLMIVAGALDTIHATIAVLVPIIGISVVLYAGALALLIAAIKVVVKSVTRHNE